LFNIDDDDELRFEDNAPLNATSHVDLSLSDDKKAEKRTKASSKKLQESSDIENTLKKLKKIRNGINKLKKNNDAPFTNNNMNIQSQEKFKLDL
jgi:small-conductance mechanosensitive channel